MNRQMKRMQDSTERRDTKSQKSARQKAVQQASERKRVGTRQFIREVIAEMRKVLWPTRKEVVNSTIIVLVTVVVLTGYVFGLDQLFTRFVFDLF